MTNPNDKVFAGEFKEGTLTKREHFAAAALQGYMASYAGSDTVTFVEGDARRCVAAVDALIAALNATP